MDEIVSLTIMIVLILIICISTYILIRNSKVFEFKTKLNEICYSVCNNHIETAENYDNVNDYIREHNKIIKLWDSINDISWDKMLWSIKPLKVEYWLNEEQLEFIKDYIDYESKN